VEVGGGDHGGFVNHDQGAAVDLHLAVLDEMQGLGHGESVIAGTAVEGFVDGLTGGAHTSTPLPARCAAARKALSECVVHDADQPKPLAADWRPARLSAADHNRELAPAQLRLCRRWRR
jgi:hypothetical protein